MSSRLKCARLPVPGLMSGLYQLLLIILIAFPHFIHAENQSTLHAASSLHNPDLAKGVLLIAGKKLDDPNFEKTVILITEFDSGGTTGLVINRRTNIPATEIMPELKKMGPLYDYLYVGGPVTVNNINLLIRSENSLATAKQITKNIYLVNTMDQFMQLVPEEIEPENLKLFSGLAGWAPGQLESELIRGDWYLWHANAETVFNPVPEDIWHELIRTVSAMWVKNSLPGSVQTIISLENML